MSSSQLYSQFPEDFIFGVATASYQIEGAHDKDGRKPSIWDAFCREPGRVYRSDNGDIACDHYHRWASDLDLISSLGMDAYRFSIAWPRVVPDGAGAINPLGLDFYDRLVDGCLRRGLQPFATLYHWDLPLALHQQGGWKNRATALAFADFANAVIGRIGDRLSTVATFNEPWCSAILGHLEGVHAPGEQSLDSALACVHHQHLAHGLAVQAIRARSPALDTGIVLNLQSIYPASDSTEEGAAAERCFDFHNGIFIEPLFTGSYPGGFLEALGDRLPIDWKQDLSTIHQPLDFWGLNYYTPTRVRHDGTAEYPSIANLPAAKGVPVTDIGWEINAAAFGDLIQTVYDRYELPDCYITENGACYNDEPVDGEVVDQNRIDYLASHLQVLAACIEQGVPLKGYFAWSLMDNFEWAEGYRMRFGLVHVDYDSQLRTIKNSGHWYGALARAHRADVSSAGDH